MHTFLTKYNKILLLIIIVLGLFLRVYNLGNNPPSLNWDEASTGYNAYSILKTGKDEYGNFLPLSIRSFDDYKPPLYTYLCVPFIAAFGVSETAVRLPSAILGTFSIILMYFLILELFPKVTKKEGGSAAWHGFNIPYFRGEVALVGVLFFAISPWSLQFSRAAYEGNIGLFFLIGGLLFFLLALKKHWYLFLSSIFFVLSMYAYHSFRLVVPLLLIVMLVLFYKTILNFKKIVVLSIFLFVILVAPIFYNLLSSSSGTGSRLSMVTIFGPSPNLDQSIKELEYDEKHHDTLGEIFHNRRVVYFLAITKGYLDHYNPDFLFLHGDGGEQHHAVDMGMLYLFDLPLVLLGFILLCTHLTRRTLLILAFMALAPLPSAITTGTPHPVRAIAMLSTFIVFTAIGAVWFIKVISGIKYTLFSINLKYVFLPIFFSLLSINVVYYFHQYYVETPLSYATAWQYGYKQAVLYAAQNESKFKTIIVTYKYDQPYVYYLFYNKIDPSWYQKNWNFTGTGEMPRFERKIGKYDFRNINWGPDQQLKNALIIGTPDEVPDSSYLRHVIYLPNGTVSLKISET